MLSPLSLPRICAALALTATLALGGCGGVDGVELNGKVFDWMGISPSALDAKKAEPKIAERAPLVLPPDANRLPEPGSGQTVAGNDLNWPMDPEQKKVAAAKEREKLHLAYCRGEIQWKEKALDPQNTGANRSPYGPCPGLGTITSSITKN
jgi:hypothetical protein